MKICGPKEAVNKDVPLIENVKESPVEDNHVENRRKVLVKDNLVEDLEEDNRGNVLVEDNHLVENR